MASVLVGTVKGLFRYPVKSMRGEPIAETVVGWAGLRGDRRYAFVRADNASHFPWLTGRQVPNLLRYAPFFADPADPARGPVRVVTPDGADLPIESDALRDELAAQYGADLTLLHSGRGIPDAAAVSLIGAATVEDLGGPIGERLEPIRFRPNILVAAASGQPYEEERWVGELLAFGDGDGGARARINQRDKRCMMVNLDPARASQNPAVLREIARTRDQCLGVYGSPEGLGTIRVGDPVYLHRP